MTLEHTDPDDVTDPTKNRSLARIEKTERRQQRTMVAMFVAFLLLVAVGGAALYWYFSSSLGAKPAARGYGTAQFDESAQAYLVNAAAKREGVAGYLAFPGFEGQLVYTDGATSEEAAAEEEASPPEPQPARAKAPSTTAIRTAMIFFSVVFFIIHTPFDSPAAPLALPVLFKAFPS